MCRRLIRCRRAFTLIELIVVIAALSVLAACLLPVFSRVREKARQTQCLSNLRQIGLATFEYAQDSDDHYPYGGDPSDLNTGDYWKGSTYWPALQQMRDHNQTLPNVMAGYVKDRNLWRCPDDTGFTMGGSSENIPLDAGSSCFRTFGMSYISTTTMTLNGQTLGNVRAWSRRPPYSEHEPANIPLLSDHVSYWHGGTARSDGRRNMVMLDGHAVSVTRDQSDELYSLLFTIPEPGQL